MPDMIYTYGGHDWSEEDKAYLHERKSTLYRFSWNRETGESTWEEIERA